MKTFAFAVISGMGLVAIALLIAFAFVWMNPAGGDSWDAWYFFTHPAFFVIFGTGFIAGMSWKMIHRGYTNR